MLSLEKPFGSGNARWLTWLARGSDDITHSPENDVPKGPVTRTTRVRILVRAGDLTANPTWFGPTKGEAHRSSIPVSGTRGNQPVPTGRARRLHGQGESKIQVPSARSGGGEGPRMGPRFGRATSRTHHVVTEEEADARALA